MSGSKLKFGLFGAKVSSEKEITELVSTLKPGETKLVMVGDTMRLITLSDEGKVSIITKSKKGESTKEVIDLW